MDLEETPRYAPFSHQSLTPPARKSIVFLSGFSGESCGLNGSIFSVAMDATVVRYAIHSDMQCENKFDLATTVKTVII
jgi:hypothetical protein